MNALLTTGRIAFLLVPFTLCFWERGNTFVLFIYGGTVLLQPSPGERLRRALRQYGLLPFLALYAFTALSLLWSEDLYRGAFILEKKTALAALPVLMALDSQISRRLVCGSMCSLVAGCVLVLWAALGCAAWEYKEAGESSVFFYHALGRPFGEFNAIYFSFFVLVSIVFFDFLMRERAIPIPGPGWLAVAVSATLALGLVLLSSRLFIALGLLYGIVWLAGIRQEQKVFSGRGGSRALAILLIAAGALAIVINRGRFREVAESRFEVLRQEEFRWDTPFNGLTLRLLLLKLGWEALNEENAVAQGLGVGDVRQAMNGLVRRYNLYHGNPELGDTGYLDYSLHNQYMESWLQAGLPALAAWLWLLALAGRKGWKAGRRFPLIWLVLFTTAFALSESVLERQRGLVLIVFFLSALYSNKAYEGPEVARTEADARLE